MKKNHLYILLLTLIFTTLSACKPQTGTDSLSQSYNLSTDYLITQYSDITGQHSSFYTIENNEYFIIIDGGWEANVDTLRQIIAEHNNTVNAWIITHPHKDHAGAFNAIMGDPENITVQSIYDNGFDYEFIKNAGEKYDDLQIMETYYSLTKDLDFVTHLHRGDVVDICGLTVNVFNSYDNIVLENIGGELDYQNNASLMLKITNSVDSILICADIKYDMDPYLNSTLTPEDLACTYVQCGHHGNWSLSEDFYNKTGASTFLLDAPAAITESADFPASTLKDYFEDSGKHVFDFTTTPNCFVLK